MGKDSVSQNGKKISVKGGNIMMEYKIWVCTPGKGQIIVKITANNPTAAMAAAKAQGGPGAYCGIMSSKPV